MIQQAYKYVVALFNVFRGENHLNIEIKWVGTGKECVAIGTKCFCPRRVLAQRPKPEEAP